MTIKIIKCPRLNSHQHYVVEIAVKFGETGNEEPLEIMCDKYGHGRGCGKDHRDKTKYHPCIFEKWKPLKKREEQ